MIQDSPQTVSTERSASEHSTEEYSDAHSITSSFEKMQNWDDEDVASAQSTPTLEEANSKETSPGGHEEKVPDQPTVTTPTDSSSEPQVYVSMQELMNQLFTAIVSTESELSTSWHN